MHKAKHVPGSRLPQKSDVSPERLRRTSRVHLLPEGGLSLDSPDIMCPVLKASGRTWAHIYYSSLTQPLNFFFVQTNALKHSPDRLRLPALMGAGGSFGRILLLPLLPFLHTLEVPTVEFCILPLFSCLTLGKVL